MQIGHSVSLQILHYKIWFPSITCLQITYFLSEYSSYIFAIAFYLLYGGLRFYMQIFVDLFLTFTDEEFILIDNVCDLTKMCYDLKV